MAKYSLMVVEGDTKAPFLRGVLTHSLLKRGLSFKQAYGIANTVRERFQKDGEVSRRELRRAVNSIVKKEYGSTVLSRRQLLPNVIQVEGSDRVPFSKGILSGSLNATGLDPSVAYATAAEIQAKLLEKDRKTISRKKLRRMVHDELLHTHGRELADRYLVWRYVGSPGKPVVLLIGGSSGAGKTSLGSDAAHHLGIGGIVTTDSIREIMRLMFSSDLLPTLHYSSYEAWKSWPVEDSLEGVIHAFVEQSTRVNVGVKALVDRASRESHNLAIEGVHLVPGLIDYQRLTAKAYFVHVILANLDVENYARRFSLREVEEAARPSDKYLENLDTIFQIQDYILEMAHLHKTPIVETQDSEKALTELIITITDSLREQLDLEGEKLVESTL